MEDGPPDLKHADQIVIDERVSAIAGRPSIAEEIAPALFASHCDVC
jgi:hypothetical protein